MSRAPVVLTSLAILLGSTFPSATSAAASDGAWSQIVVPFSFGSHTAVYDTLTDRIIAFGGTGAGTADAWSLSLSGTPTWTRIVTTGPHPLTPQVGHSAIIDPVARRMIIWGGLNLTETWALSLDGVPAWSLLATHGTPPPARNRHTAVYDSRRHRMLIFGGYLWAPTSGDGATQEVWSLDLTTLTWSQIVVAGVQPGERFEHCALYDPVRDRMFVWSGERHGDAFYLSLGGTIGWTRVNSGPPPRVWHGCVYDPIRRRMVIFGGHEDAAYPYETYNDVWGMSLEGAMSWTQVFPAGTLPSPRWKHTLAYDSRRDRMVLIGGEGGATAPYESWALSLQSGSQWVTLNPDGLPPPALADGAWVYDSARGRAIAFGGGPPNTNETWFLPLVGAPNWSRMQPSGIPPTARAGHSGIYDPVRDRMLIFGGDAGVSTPLFNDVWALSLSGAGNWQQVFGDGTAPIGRRGHSAVYDPTGDRMIVFGGTTRTGALNDVWSLSLGASPTWTPLSLSPAPPGVSRHSAIMDVSRHRMIVFGGSNPPDSANDAVWSLDLSGEPFWSSFLPGGSVPRPRVGHTSILDAAGDRMVLWGGCSTCTAPYALSLAGTPTWTLLSPAGTPPAGRSQHQAVYDPLNSRMLVTGGNVGTDSRSVYELRWDSPVATQLALAAMDARPDRVVLVWEGIGAGEISAAVSRREEGGAWRLIGTAEREDADRLRFEDRAISAGSRYDYRLSWLEDGVERVGPETWIDVPIAPTLALEGLRPNPAMGAINVSFSLGNTSSANLELLDLAGRRVLGREVGGLGPGRHLVRLDDGKGVQPGVYWVRLRQGGLQFRTRAAVVR